MNSGQWPAGLGSAPERGLRLAEAEAIVLTAAPSPQRLAPLPAQLQLGSKAIHIPGSGAQLGAQLIIDQPTDLPGLEHDSYGEHQPRHQEPNWLVHQSDSGDLLFLQRLLCWC